MSKAKQPVPPREPTFIEVALAPEVTAPVLELVVADGLVVRVPTGFDAATLGRLLEVLGARP